MKKRIKLTTAQALVKYLSNQYITVNQQELPFCAGVFSIFGHGNVAGIGEALYQYKDQLPTYRAHNEQAMAHTAIAYSKAQFAQQIMACTSSIGPGATNFVTAAALAHVNRLPVLFLPGDVFTSRNPDPVLQQVEAFHNPTITANDCLAPVSRFFDRITHPAQLLTSLPQAINTMIDPINRGPVTLAMPQDTQTVAYDYPVEFFEKKMLSIRRSEPDQFELKTVTDLIKQAKKVLVIAGGGVLYSRAFHHLKSFVEQYQIPVVETQAGKGSLPFDHAMQLGAIGVTGMPQANQFANNADLILAVGTRLQDFTTGSHSLFKKARIISINTNSYDSCKFSAHSLVCDAAVGLEKLQECLGDWHGDKKWSQNAHEASQDHQTMIQDIVTRKPDVPYDAQIIGAIQSKLAESSKNDVAVCAAGTLPAELHKLWRTSQPGNYHVEYGYSCMGYEIAGGIGVKMAQPKKEVIVLVGDGSYLMLNSEIATSILLKQKLIIVVQDNKGFGCINRLQEAVGGVAYNNLIEDCTHYAQSTPWVDFAGHAKSLGARSEFVTHVDELNHALKRARDSEITYVIEIKTTPHLTTKEGGSWWEVAIPEVSERKTVNKARKNYTSNKLKQQNIIL